MAKKQVSAPAAAPTNRPPYMLIEEIRVQGYKSLVDATLHVRPLTLLAGTNSSGKSSIVQPLLLIKQTMEAPYQPAGALVLDGAHVQAETAGELLSKVLSKSTQFSITTSGRHKNKGEQRMLLNLVYEEYDGNFQVKSQQTASGPDFQFKVNLEPGLSWNDFYNQAINISPINVQMLDKMGGTVVQDSSGFLSVLLNRPLS